MRVIYRFERTIRTSNIIRTTSTLPFLASSYHLDTAITKHASQLPRSRMFLCISTTTRPIFRHLHFHFHSHCPTICIHKDSADLVGLAEAYNPSEDCNQSSGASSHTQWAGAAFRLAEVAYLVHRYILFISSITVDRGGRTSSKRP
jgi:hypothetical protein